jgi:hypothetical protein
VQLQNERESFVAEFFIEECLRIFKKNVPAPLKNGRKILYNDTERMFWELDGFL